jgi:hypothetical protein
MMAHRTTEVGNSVIPQKPDTNLAQAVLELVWPAAVPVLVLGKEHNQ